MRVKAVIAYDGTDFEGFQRQTRTANTVTGAIEAALRNLQIDSPVTGSGRTDAGVHATGQVIHFDLPSYWHDLKKLRDHLNGRLEGIIIKHITPVPDGFHARYDARRRIYRYLFSVQTPHLFLRRYVAHIPVRDFALLSEALTAFEGRHDFGYFKKTGSPTHDDIRTVYRAYIKDLGTCHAIYIEADGFLRAQVRMMLSAAFDVADGKLSLEALTEQIHRTVRHTTRLAPPQGLYLARVIYGMSETFDTVKPTASTINK